MARVEDRTADLVDDLSAVLTEDLDAVVFDLDDTLVDHRAAVRGGLRTWLPALGVDPGPEGVWLERWLRVEERHMARWRAGELSFAAQRRARLRELLPQVADPADDDAVDALFADWVRRWMDAQVAFPDALPTIRAAQRSGWVTGVLTNGPHEQQSAKVRRTGLAEVGPVVSSGGLGVGKPDPRAFLAACAAVGAVPARTLYVGDSVEVDVRPARAAGLRAVLLDRTGSATGDQHRVRSLLDLVV